MSSPARKKKLEGKKISSNTQLISFTYLEIKCATLAFSQNNCEDLGRKPDLAPKTIDFYLNNVLKKIKLLRAKTVEPIK